jgi:peptidoglycan hydrolase CwlO-like protein
LNNSAEAQADISRTQAALTSKAQELSVAQEQIAAYLQQIEGETQKNTSLMATNQSLESQLQSAKQEHSNVCGQMMHARHEAIDETDAVD